MSLVKTWYRLEEAQDKYGVSKEKILELVEEGLIRYEKDGEEVARINIDDLKLELDRLLETD